MFFHVKNLFPIDISKYPKSQLFCGELWHVMTMILPWSPSFHKTTAFHGRVAPPLNRSTEVAVTRSSPMGTEWRRGVLERLVCPKSGANFLAPKIQKKCEETEEMSSFDSWSVASEVHVRSYFVDNVGLNDVKYSSMHELCVGCIRQCTFHFLICCL